MKKNKTIRWLFTVTGKKKIYILLLILIQILHGGSGVPDDQLEKAFTMGINKFNVGTEYFYLYFQTVKEYCQNHEDIFDMQMLVQERLQDYLRQKLQLCTMTV